MNLEQQVCSLELAKKLKVLGVRQESAFYWWDPSFGNDRWKILFNEHSMELDSERISAFTVAELGEMLPIGYCTVPLHEERRGRTWIPEFAEDGKIKLLQNFGSDTEADARAKILIYLIEQGVVKP